MARIFTESMFWGIIKLRALRSLLCKDFSDLTRQLLKILVTMGAGLRNRTLKTLYIKTMNCGQFKLLLIPIRD